MEPLGSSYKSSYQRHEEVDKAAEAEKHAPSRFPNAVVWFAVLVVLILTFCLYRASLNDPTMNANLTTMSLSDHEEWLPFDGDIKDQGHHVYLLTGRKGGHLEVRSNDVNRDGEKIFVRKGADAIDVSKLFLSKQLLTECTHVADCRKYEKDCATCIGLVMKCCAGGGIIGGCFGFSLCP